jgi:lysophospholipase L1-like esterase
MKFRGQGDWCITRDWVRDLAATSDGFIKICGAGDSNSAPGAVAAVASASVWQNVVRRSLGGRKTWVVKAPGVGGAMISSYATDAFWGWTQVKSALAENTEVIVMAFGTNDFRVLSQQPSSILAAYQMTVTSINATGATAFVCTCPPNIAPDPIDIRSQALILSDLIRANFPAWQVVDFDTWVVSEDLVAADGVHFTNSAQVVRAAKVLEKIKLAGL